MLHANKDCSVNHAYMVVVLLQAFLEEKGQPFTDLTCAGNMPNLCLRVLLLLT